MGPRRWRLGCRGLHVRLRFITRDFGLPHQFERIRRRVCPSSNGTINTVRAYRARSRESASGAPSASGSAATAAAAASSAKIRIIGDAALTEATTGHPTAPFVSANNEQNAAGFALDDAAASASFVGNDGDQHERIGR